MSALRLALSANQGHLNAHDFWWGPVPWRCKIMLLLRLWALGSLLHPEEISKAWHASDCDPEFKPRVSRSVLVRWRVACFLRGCSR